MARRYAGVYNALHWRTRKLADTSTTNNGLDQQRTMWYSASWQVLQEDVDDFTNCNADGTGRCSPTPNGTDRVYQQFWGLRYIDDPVMRRVDANADGDFADADDKTYFHLTDVQFSTVAMVSLAGQLSERTSYTPYGEARHRFAADVNNDGSVTSADLSIINAAAAANGGSGTPLADPAIPDNVHANYNAAADMDRSGVIDGADAALYAARAGLGNGPVSEPSTAGNPGAPENQFGYCGYVFNHELKAYTVRFRWYEPGIGRWVERDPIGYSQHLSLLTYANSSPIMLTDPLGLDPDGIQWHHLIPQVFRDKGLVGDWIDDAEFGLLMRQADHCGKGGPKGTHDKWNAAWAEFFGDGKQPRTREEVEAFLTKLRDKEEFKNWLKEGVKAHIKYGKDGWAKIKCKADGLAEAIDLAIKRGEDIPAKLLAIAKPTLASLDGMPLTSIAAAAKATVKKSSIVRFGKRIPVLSVVFGGLVFFTSTASGESVYVASVDAISPVSVEDIKYARDVGTEAFWGTAANMSLALRRRAPSQDERTGDLSYASMCKDLSTGGGCGCANDPGEKR